MGRSSALEGGSGKDIADLSGHGEPADKSSSLGRGPCEGSGEVTIGSTGESGDCDR